MELATTTHARRHRAVSDLNDTWPHDDPDVIAVSKNKEGDRVVDLTRVAANIMRVADADRDRSIPAIGNSCSHLKLYDDRDAATNVAARPSSGSRDLATMVMFDLDVER
jgi:hypothetical protein